MARDKTDKTDSPPAATLATTATRYEPPPPNDDEVRSVLKIFVTQRLHNLIRKPALGLHRVATSSYRVRTINNEQRLSIDDHDAQCLVDDATGRDGVLPDPYAFNAACVIGAELLRNNWEMPPAIREFSADVLAGRISYPAIKNRPKQTNNIDLWSVSLALALLSLGWVKHLGENTLTEKATARPKRLNATRAVADAFSADGYHTTQAQVKALCSSKQYAELRTTVGAEGLGYHPHLLVMLPSLLADLRTGKIQLPV
jgi:hypothetical protein